jgi:hypothetical protein
MSDDCERNLQRSNIQVYVRNQETLNPLYPANQKAGEGDSHSSSSEDNRGGGRVKDA